LRTRKKIRMAMIARAATPPTTPPAIGPMLTDREEVWDEGGEVGETGGVVGLVGVVDVVDVDDVEVGVGAGE
jgi:hypothetical protein